MNAAAVSADVPSTSASNQFALLTQRRFAPFFWVQFLGAGNDNVFKFAFTVLVTYQLQVSWLPPAMAGLVIGALFIFPFLLFSATSGQLADKFPKERLIRLVKDLEIVIMLLAGYGFLQQNVPVLLSCVFLMGLHSTLFGPVKFAYLPQHLSERELTGGNGMVEMGTMTEAQKNEIYAELPEFPKVERDSQFGGPKGFLLNMVQDELKAKGFTEEQINGGGLSIITTFDAKAQEAAVKAAQKITADTAATGNKKAKNLHAGLASIDVETGGVLALYGGPDFVKDSRNWATTARPTGSTFKPYALGAALDQGFTLNDKLNGSQFTPPGENTPVRNAGDRNYGTVNLLQATTNSINTAYVDLEGQMDDGPENTLAFAQAGESQHARRLLEAGLAQEFSPRLLHAYAGLPDVSARARRQQVERWCDEHGTLLISDEIYHGIAYGDARTSSAWETSKESVAIGSVSS